MWRLPFEGQILQDNLKEYMIPQYLLYDSAREDENTWVDISEFVKKRINAAARYVSPFGPGWKNYKANLSEAEVEQLKDAERNRIRIKNGEPVEGFRYYKGLPDSLGK